MTTLRSESLRPFAFLCTALRTFLIVAGLTGPVAAQDGLFSSGAPLDPREAFALSVTPQPDGSRLLRWEIADGYYLYRDYLAVETDTRAPVPLESDPGTQKEDPTFGAVEVYYDQAEARIGPVSDPLSVTYQGCQEDGICYPPITDSLPALPVAAPDGPKETGSPAFTPGGGITLAEDAGLVEGLVQRGGLRLLLLGFFGFGLLLAFTPCVLPMIPILGGLLAGQGESLTARRGLALSATYVLAMSSALALLGVAAAWSGQNLQIVLQSPLAVGGVALLFAALALSMFGLFELRFPQAWNDRMATAGSGRRGTFAGAAGLGFTSALIMGPCVTAPLAGALLYIAQTGDTALGAAALFSLGLGQGVPLLLLGAFGSRALPRAGRWMQVVNRLFGFVFLVMAAWLAGRVVPPAAGLAIWAGVLVLTGVFLGALDRPEAGAAPVQRLRQAAGIAALLAGALMGVGAASGGDDPLRPLAGLRGEMQTAVSEKAIDFTTIRSVPELEAALAQSDRPALIYFTADWCVSCRAIERHVWPDAGVQAALSEMQVIAADLTKFDSESQGLLDHLRSVGPPTMVFLDAEGREREDTRLIGEPGPADVMASARAVQ
ncbi:protein-disulfide reductase DsbD [Sagittula salina]|uniref:Protein-disulfide reductase DsbD n=1 Tax=Sagittula salina TaxID=2820268 RepID=A0A940MPQ3_9RHOB|nr:protein-disulfide reductase DsbD [Sagittula salina]MBP0483189.1 protein-disulfide reductase DsbD [Sagittula salina]